MAETTGLRKALLKDQSVWLCICLTHSNPLLVWRAHPWGAPKTRNPSYFLLTNLLPLPNNPVQRPYQGS